MHNYECEVCKGLFEIEEYEAMFGHHEYYENGMCQGCFDKFVEEDTQSGM